MTGLTRLSCEEVFRLLDDYLDRNLRAEEMERVRAHLAVCEVCASEYRFEARVLEGVKEKVRRMDAPDDLLSRVIRALD